MVAVEQDTKSWFEVIHFGNRRHPRFDIQLPIDYYQFKSSITHIGNISEGGLLVYLPDEIDIGQYLRLKLYFSLGSELHTIGMLVEVVWKGDHLTEDGDYYPYGVRFVDISLEDWKKLRDLLRNLSSPLDSLLFPPSDLRVRFKIEEFMNRRRGQKNERIFKTL